ncbi:MAG: hypothetical protein Q9164_002793, partial [Protoblastenia rupestris]
TVVAITTLPTTQAGSNEAPVPEPATIITVPPGAPTADLTNLFLTKFGPLWQPRQTVGVSQGQTFEIGEFVVRVGELRQIGGSGGQVVKGVVCEVEWVGDEEDGEQDLEVEKEVIRGFWEGMGVKEKGVREWFWRAEVGGKQGEERGRCWLEALRMRG